jgi:hypothetical protein
MVLIFVATGFTLFVGVGEGVGEGVGVGVGEGVGVGVGVGFSEYFCQIKDFFTEVQISLVLPTKTI